jgi:hypothetical protein
VWARPLRLGGETLRSAAAFDAIAAHVHVEPAQCTEDDAPLHKFIGPAK